MKTCIKCGEEKAEGKFYLLAGKYKGTGRRMNRCKSCHNATCVERQRSPEAKARIVAWKTDNPERVRELNRRHSKLWRERHPEERRATRLKSKLKSLMMNDL
jgi:hypothetical protein